MSIVDAPELALRAAEPLNGDQVDSGRRTRLWMEFGALFFAAPATLALAFERLDWRLWVALSSATIACLILLLTDPTFDRRVFFRREAFTRGAIFRSLGLWATAALAMGGLIRWAHPDWFLALPRERPALWAAIMVLYPLMSVVPQNIVYRAFIFHRYRTLFGSGGWNMTWASAIAFSFAHVVFHNSVALGLTAVGGLIFAHTYDKHRSVPLVSAEHALYGCAVFTLGLGRYLYAGMT